MENDTQGRGPAQCLCNSLCGGGKEQSREGRTGDMVDLRGWGGGGRGGGSGVNK